MSFGTRNPAWPTIRGRIDTQGKKEMTQGCATAKSNTADEERGDSEGKDSGSVTQVESSNSDQSCNNRERARREGDGRRADE